ncbi:MAG: GAF domain-containing protein [Pegethrix bostrychoides GSE-TBD4-15B]|jgi:signal transduction histidine kinase/DNA-binding response OmpR family regulator|uniref:Circadian input-output histidine kinase CikA n=1 Tax=Pegethrix bostrychoides GSE-TBD4-15B TaxID=2839662 RepID=A0A951P798_9CYAN|nr:GAF domain-containing protein [Pegethrix bostrychoides GSE-TBD4-15B]
MSTHSGRSKESILIVGAAPRKLRLLATALAEQGCQVRFAPNAGFALKSIQVSLPNLILLSLETPDLDGYRFCQRLKAAPLTANLPVILLGAALDDPVESSRISAQIAAQIAAVDWIPQPLHLELVLGRIEYQLQVLRLRRALEAQQFALEQERQQRQQAEQTLARQSQRNLLLQQVTAAICSQMDSQLALEAAIAQIGQTFRVNRASIHIYVPPPIPEIPLIAEYVEAGYVSMRQISFVLEDGLFLPEVLAQDRAVAAVDVRGDCRVEAMQQLCELSQIKSLLAIRTSYRNQANGVITLQQCDGHRQWTADETASLEMVAAQIGLALAQAKTLEQEQKQLEALGYQNLVLRQEICERRQIEAALKASDAELRGLFAAMVDVVIVLDWQGHYLRVAPTSQENLYRPIPELVGQRLHQVFEPAQADRFLEAIRTSLVSQQTLELEYSLIIQAQEVWFNAKISPIGTDAVLWVARDITARRQTEAELRHKSAALSEFSLSLEQLHRLSLTDFDSIETICADYLKTGCDILGFMTGAVIQVTADQEPAQTQYRVLAVESSQPTLLLAGRTLSWTDGHTLLQSRQTVFDGQSLAQALPVYAERSVASYLTTPVWVDGEIYGQLCFFSARGRRQGYEHHESDIIELMAQSIGKFISSHQVRAKRQQAEEEIQLLLNITQAITAAPDFNAALYEALSALCQTTGWVYGEVWLPAADGAVLESSAVWYCSSGSGSIPDSTIAAVQQFRQSSRAVTFQPNQGIAGRVWSQQQPEWTTDDQGWPEPEPLEPFNSVDPGAALGKSLNDSQFQDSQFQDSQFQYRFQLVNHYGIKARLGVPILTTERDSTQRSTVLAVMVFFALEARPQEQRLIQLVSGVAMQLGAVLAQKQAEDALRQSAEREQTLLRVIERMRQTLDIEQIFRTTAEELHQLLKCDRVLIYRFNPDWSGEIVAEAVSSCWRPVLRDALDRSLDGSLEAETPLELADATGDELCVVRTWREPTSAAAAASSSHLVDTYLQDTQGGVYRQGTKYLCVRNVQQAELTDCYRVLLNQLQAKAYLTVPIFQGQRLWGLLAVYQNSGPRNWQPSEINLVTHISTQLGVAIQQADLLAQTQQQSADLEKAKDAAESANRAKTQFLAHMSHELRTPLNSILGFTQIVGQEGSLSPEHRDYLQIVSSSGQHLLELINNVLELARLETHHAGLQVDQFDLLLLLERVEGMFRLAAAEKQLHLNFIIAADLPRYVIADAGKLRQILLNLLDNAIKFTQQGSITLHAEPTGGAKEPDRADLMGIEFTVSDTGYGIAPEEIELMFEAFVQLEAGRQSNQGTGLGLGISRRLVELMGSRLQVSSQMGVGSQFKFEIFVQMPSADSRPLDLGVHCIYEALSVAQPVAKTLPQMALQTARAALDLMPQDWVEQLAQAASGCSERQVFQLVEKIPAEQSDLAKTLADLASNFQFEAILGLTAQMSCNFQIQSLRSDE